MLLPVLGVLVLLFVVLWLVGMVLWSVLSAIVVGLIIGALGRLVVPGAQRIGILATIAAGLGGSVVGGFLGQHVWGLGHILTILIEIGISAGIVAIMSAAGGGRQIHSGGARRSLPR